MKLFGLILAAVTYLICGFAFAGGGAHGGGGYLCADKTQNELLDLWEAKAYHKLEIVRTDEPVYSQIVKALDRLREINEELWKIARNRLDMFYTEDGIVQDFVLSIPDDASIPFPDDAKNAMDKKDCQPVGLAKYLDAKDTRYEIGRPQKDALLIDSKLVSMFPNTDQAGLFVHELVYLLDRGLNNAPDSRSTRFIVGHLFAQNFTKEALRKALAVDGKYLHNSLWRPHGTKLPGDSLGRVKISISVADPDAMISIKHLVINEISKKWPDNFLTNPQHIVPIQPKKRIGNSIEIDLPEHGISNIFDHKLLLGGIKVRGGKSGKGKISITFSSERTGPFKNFQIGYTRHRILSALFPGDSISYDYYFYWVPTADAYVDFAGSRDIDGGLWIQTAML